MAIDPVTAVSDLIKTGLEKWLPDANAREKAASELAAMVHQASMAQIEVNKIEAASNSLFVAGWRPAVGWCCVVGYAYHFVAQPFVLFLLTVAHWQVDIAQLPELNIGELGIMLANLLGFGAYRTYEKVKGNGK